MNEDNKYINIKDVAEAKGLTSTRSIRLELNKIESKYISREIKVNGGTSYEILFSSLEPEIQKKLRVAENKTTALVPRNYKEPDFVSDKTKLTANYRANIVVALQKLRKKYPTKKEADTTFLELYNSGLYLPKAYNFIGSISIGTLHRWVRAFEKHESTECLQPKYKWSKQGEYNSILNDEMRNILLTLLLHPSKYNYGKAIKLTKEILRKRGYEELPCDLSFKRFAENFRKNNYAEWVLRREGMKAYHDKVEPYIERDISKIEVGDILVADGHVLNFQVINPFTGRPTRATLVGFLDWKSTALVGYEIMMTESTQCIASALRNSIINLGMIPKVVYQDNGKAFKSRFFQNTDFEEDLFNGVYANLNIHSVFAKPYNARAKVIERFFREFQEEFEKGMPSYIGTCIEDKPAWLKRGEKLHEEWHKKLTNNHIPTVQETIKYINGWIKFHNKNLCPNDRSKTIQEMLDSVQKQNINPQVLDDLMMKTECRTINRHGITFLNMHYRIVANNVGLRNATLDKIYSLAIWQCFYRISFLKQHNSIKFIPGLNNGEDSLFTLETLFYTNNITIEKNTTYFYRKNSDSLVTNMNNTNYYINSIHKWLNELQSFYNKNEKSYKMKQTLLRFLAAQILYKLIRKNNFNIQEKLYITVILRDFAVNNKLGFIYFNPYYFINIRIFYGGKRF